MVRYSTRVAFIGAGSIARAVADYAADTKRFEVVGVLTRSPERARGQYGDAPVTSELEGLLKTNPEIVVECAGHAAVEAFVPPLLEMGLDVILASTGSLSDPALLEKVSAASGAGRLIVPPGALVGIDGLSAASRDSLSAVKLTSTKPPKAWAGTPAADVFDFTDLAQPFTLFRGTAREAARLFPKNANVAATVALAGIGLDRTEVELVADPMARTNMHVVEAAGAFGRFLTRIEANPSPSNPRTSYMTSLSIIRAVEMQSRHMVL